MFSQVMISDSQDIRDMPVEFGKRRSNPLPLLIGITTGQISLLEDKIDLPIMGCNPTDLSLQYIGILCNITLRIGQQYDSTLFSLRSTGNRTDA